MTKLLNLTTSEFIFFTSSFSYDRENKDSSGFVIDIEDSFGYEINRHTLDNYMDYTCRKYNLLREEIEVIHD